MTMNFFSDKKRVNIATVLAVVVGLILSLLGLYFVKSKPEGEGGTLVKNESIAKNSPTVLKTGGYSDSLYNFSFKLPAGFFASSMVDESGETILIRNAVKEIIGQLYVSKIESDVVLTPEIVVSQFPDTKIYDAEAIEVSGQAKIKATEFSFDPSKTRKSVEVWFTREKVLYQWTMSHEFFEKMFGIINSIKW